MTLGHLSGLTELHIGGCVAVTDVGLMLLAGHLPRLASLEMPWCLKVTHAGGGGGGRGPHLCYGPSPVC